MDGYQQGLCSYTKSTGLQSGAAWNHTPLSPRLSWYVMVFLSWPVNDLQLSGTDGLLLQAAKPVAFVVPYPVIDGKWTCRAGEYGAQKELEYHCR